MGCANCNALAIFERAGADQLYFFFSPHASGRTTRILNGSPW
jgi:hypothetical protein